MATFPTADDALNAAAQMQQQIAAHAELKVDGQPVAIRIGCHFGPGGAREPRRVRRRRAHRQPHDEPGQGRTDHHHRGDRRAALARVARCLRARSTSPRSRAGRARWRCTRCCGRPRTSPACCRRSPAMHARGAPCACGCAPRIVSSWSTSGTRASPSAAPRTTTWWCKGNLISRLHARIEISRNKFVLVDQSTNGTFVQTADGEEAFVRRDSVQIKGQGMIGLGRAARAAARRSRSDSTAKRPDAPASRGAPRSAEPLLGGLELREQRRRQAAAVARRGTRASRRAPCARLSASTASSSTRARRRAMSSPARLRSCGRGRQPIGGLDRADLAGAAVEHPGEHAQILADSPARGTCRRRPAEPVDVEDARRRA